MPGWYVHGEAAKRTVDRLRAGNVTAEFLKDNLNQFSDGVTYAKYLGDIGYKWRWCWSHWT